MNFIGLDCELMKGVSKKYKEVAVGATSLLSITINPVMKRIVLTQHYIGIYLFPGQAVHFTRDNCTMTHTFIAIHSEVYAK